MDRGGATLGRATREFRQHFPEPGWVEHDAEEIWESVLAAVRGALEAAKIQGDRIAAVGITNASARTTLVTGSEPPASPSTAPSWLAGPPHTPPAAPS